MQVRIEATGSLRSSVANDTVLKDVRSVAEAVEQLALPESAAVAMLVNGRVAHWETRLHDGDVLTLLPVISGG